MAFADYLDLRTAVIETVGNSTITDVFDRLTKLAENHLSRKLRLADQITSATVTFTNGVASLPADFQAAIGLYDSVGNEYVARPPQTLQQIGWHRVFSVVGATIEAKNAEGDLTLQYYASIPTITTAPTATNTLLAQYPKAYLYAVAHEAAIHLKDPEMISATLSARDAAITDAVDDDHSNRFARARVRVSGNTP